MLLIGWIVVAPALVICGLYVASGILGRRAAATGTDVTWLAHELARLLEEPVAPLGPLAASAPDPRAPIAH